MSFYLSDAKLHDQGQQILEETWAAYPWLARNQLAITWLVYDPPYPVNTGGALTQDDFWKQTVRGFNYRGVELIYPASVVKLFYLVAAHEWLHSGMLTDSPEMQRAIADMIIDSSNDATGYIVDLLTGTTSGPELAEGPFTTWKHQRNLVNRYFRSLGWVECECINANQKTWGDGPYGRENEFVGAQRENRNALSPDATARLLHSIIGGVAVTPARSQAMMALMKRSLDPAALAADPENQVTGFIGGGVPGDTGVWSKAGWTSQVRHDAAYLEVSGRAPCLLVIYTEGAIASKDETLIPFIASRMVAQLPECQ
jgi:hypothetical protein